MHRRLNAAVMVPVTTKPHATVVRPSRLVPAALVGLALAGAPALASADIFVSPFLGVKFKGDTNALSFGNGEGDAKLTLGASATMVSKRGPGLELEFGYSPRFFERSGDGLGTRSGVTTLSGNLVMALPLSITRESLRPYAVGGLGWMHASANDLIGFGPVSNDFLGLTLGVGAVGFITDVTGLRFDLRYLRSVSSGDISALTPGESAKLSFWRATIGVVFR